MSQYALLIAVRDTLRASVPLAHGDCDIELTGQPPPFWSGAAYYHAIHPTGWDPGPVDLNQGLDELYSLAITLSRRTGYIPEQRHPEELLLRREAEGAYRASFEEKARRLMVVMFSYRHTILTAANALISGDDKFIEPLRWGGNDPVPIQRGPDWFSGEPGDLAAHGFSLTLNYREARRMQALANLE